MRSGWSNRRSRTNCACCATTRFSGCAGSDARASTLVADAHVAALIDDALEHVRALERPADDVAGEPTHGDARSAAS